MSSLPVVASCEVLLSDDVLRDLFTRETNFKKRELAVAHRGGPPVASSECGGGDGAGDWVQPSPVAALQFFSVQLEKQSDAVIKLYITGNGATKTVHYSRTNTSLCLGVSEFYRKFHNMIRDGSTLGMHLPIGLPKVRVWR